MKDLKNLQNELLRMHSDSKVLSSKEKQSIKGGQYSSLEECLEDCGHWQTNNWPHGNGPTGGGECVELYPGIWDCMDS